jgi:hypothetical protein
MAIDVTRGATAGAAQYPILKLNEAKAVTPISKSAAFTLELTGGDYKTAILMANAGSASATVTFAIGNGIQGAGSDLVVTVAAGATMAICLDSGYFKNVSGTDKDAVKVTPSAAISFTIVELPQ